MGVFVWTIIREDREEENVYLCLDYLKGRGRWTDCVYVCRLYEWKR